MGRKKGQTTKPQSTTIDPRKIGVVRSLAKQLAVTAMGDESVMPLARQAAEFVKALEGPVDGGEDVLG